MSRPSTLLTILTLAASSLATQVRAADVSKPSAGSGVAIGTRVADFTLKDYHGQPHALASAQGRQGRRAGLSGHRVSAGEALCPAAGRAGQGIRAQGRGVPGRQSESPGLRRPRSPPMPECTASSFRSSRTWARRGRPGGRDAHAGSRRARRRARDPLSRPHRRSVRLRRQRPAISRRPRSAATWPTRSMSCWPASRSASPSTPLAGCLIGRDRQPEADSEVTYSKQIARIMNANCVFCHRAGQIAPFTLTSYDDVAGWAAHDRRSRAGAAACLPGTPTRSTGTSRTTRG